MFLKLRFALNQFPQSIGRHLFYWNFFQQAEKIKRNAFDETGTLVPLEAKQQAWRALVAKYQKDGLDRKVMEHLLKNLLSVPLGPG